MKKKRVMVDMSVTLIHHGHIRILKKASKIGEVYVGLTADKDLKKYKGYLPELNYSERKEVIESIKYVKKVVKVNFHVSEKDIIKHNIDYLIHGNDLKTKSNSFKTIILKRTNGVSSSLIRKKASKIFNKK
jgi:glycerol-3-phosphate cytidylyltransferase